ncbi:MAG: hypothetical protein FJ405_17860, partial [Verrucomicrobia bacterium]|nr:hypothetical protein [Verrucomicrobiota bacterium]
MTIKEQATMKTMRTTLNGVVKGFRKAAATLLGSCLLLLAMAMPAAAADAAKADGKEPAPPAAPAGAESVKLQPGDVVKITFDATTNLNTIAKIQLDGSITMQMIGDVKAVNKTTAELRQELLDRYSTLLKGEEITVTMTTANNAIYVSGAVLRPGKIPMDRPMSVMDAIME